MYDAISIEKFNKPAVALVHEYFIDDAKAASKEMPGLQVVSEAVPCECTDMGKTEVAISAVMEDIVAALTQPVTPEEKSPKQEVEEVPRIAFKGNLEEVNRFFYKRGWTDGLPIVPPTEEAVKEMLTGTALPAEYVVAKIVPQLGKATVEKIAINAVMVGALPTYMPVLIAGVQAIAEPAGGFSVHQVSTGSWSPFWVINGPVRNDLNINKGYGALSPGNMANAAIGRAMSFIIRNIGGARTGIEDKGQLGNPGKYTMVIAENEEESPWEPLHVEKGLNKEDSAVTVTYPNSFVQIWPYGTDSSGILNGVIYNIPPGTMGRPCLLLTPTHAKWLADEGWTKKEIKTFIAQYARCPAYKHFSKFHAGPPKATTVINDMELMPLVRTPDHIMIVVGGGKGGNLIGLYIGIGYEDLEFVTKKVELPANWSNVVEKYKNIVPLAGVRREV